MWVNFATNSDPNCEEIKPAIWHPLSQDTTKPFQCLNIAEEVKETALPEWERMKFWDTMYSRNQLF